MQLPKQVKVISLKNQAVIADKCFVANSFLSRLRGLMGRKKLELGHGMLFPRCNDIHMWFMRMSIDVVFLARNSADSSNEYVVTSVRENVPAWKALPLHDRRATETLELPCGIIRSGQISAGDRIQITGAGHV